MKRTILLLLLLVNSISYGQIIRILDRETSEPLGNVAVYNQIKTKTLISGIDGTVDISIFNENERIYFRLYGYANEYISKKVASQKKNIYLHSKSEVLDEIVVSISKWQQQKRDIPQKISTIRSESVTFANPQTAADFLQNSGQVFVQKSQLGGGSPIIRGFSTNRLLLTVDGVRMNTAIFRGGNLQNVISIDPFVIDRTEVIFGAGSVIYGSDAVGGVMNFYTKAPSLSLYEDAEWRGAAVSRYSTANNEKTIHADIKYAAKKWGLLSSVSFSDFEDLRMGSHGPKEYLRESFVKRENGEDIIVENENPKVQVPTGYSQINFMQKVVFEPNDTWKYDLGFYYSTTSDYARYDRLLRTRDDNPRSAEWFYGPQRWLMANFQINKKGNGKWYDRLRATVAYQHFEESRNNRDFQSIVKNSTEEKVDAYSFNLDMEKKMSEKFSIYYGLEYIFNAVDSEGSTLDIDTREKNDAASRYPDGSTWQSIASYINMEYKPNTKVSFLAGLRYNHILLDANFNNRFFDFPFSNTSLSSGAVTGSLGLSWLPVESWQITLNGTTAFRAPNIDDIGKIFDSEPGSVVVPNPDLNPEYAYNAEFGIRKNVNDKVSLSFSTFFTFLDNALVRRDFLLNGESVIDFQGEASNVQAVQNAAKAKAYGFEFGLDAFLSDRLSFNSNLTITNGEEEIDNGETAPLRHAPPLFADMHFIWTNNTVKFDFFANYNGETDFEDLAPSEQNKPFIYAVDKNGNPYSPSWYTLNFRSQYKISKHLETNISLENITDQRFRSYSSGITAPGRNFIVGVRYLF
ncbi:TonB-dependent receptor plug domain-containing protein [Ascidiimonas sp. W6]|uniref:TonB-dependent receptor plug domain-containing protein n=1 Tax=Ascidiimonas meishanensis TaxID=3128903 RepID=UPI0030EBE8FC